MFQIGKSHVRIHIIGLLLLCSPFSLSSQVNEQASIRLDRFMNESCKTTYEEILSESLTKILRHKVYYITRETKNIYGKKEKTSSTFIVIDNGDNIKTFEKIKTNTELPELLSYIRQDFILDSHTAPQFQTMLDFIYPIPSWKPDKREFFFKNGKWYFLRDAYFRSKQGFEVTIDSDGKITAICYKMKWDDKEQS